MTEDSEVQQPPTAADGEPATGFPEPPGRDPGDRSQDPEADRWEGPKRDKLDE